jgi:hypothetical protein
MSTSLNVSSYTAPSVDTVVPVKDVPVGAGYSSVDRSAEHAEFINVTKLGLNELARIVSENLNVAVPAFMCNCQLSR